MQPGIYHDIANDTYHKGPGLSNSGLQRFRKTPFHFHALAQPRDLPAKEPSPQMKNGTRVHCALLEPDQFDLRYQVGPAVESKREKVWKEFAAYCERMGVEPITKVEYDAAMGQAASLAALPEVAELLGYEGYAESSVYWIDPATGVLCKCRPDRLCMVAHGKATILLDVKTTGDATDNEFSKSIANYGYHHQAAWYCGGVSQALGMPCHGMLFGVVESEYPYAARPVMLTDSALTRGRDENTIALKRYAECESSGIWPGFPAGIAVLDLPHWAYR